MTIYTVTDSLFIVIRACIQKETEWTDLQQPLKLYLRLHEHLLVALDALRKNLVLALLALTDFNHPPLSLWDTVEGEKERWT